MFNLQEVCLTVWNMHSGQAHSCHFHVASGHLCSTLLCILILPPHPGQSFMSREHVVFYSGLFSRVLIVLVADSLMVSKYLSCILTGSVVLKRKFYWYWIYWIGNNCTTVACICEINCSSVDFYLLFPILTLA